MRKAISPRLAISIFSNIALANHKQGLTILNRLAIFYHHRLDDAGPVRLDLIEQLHRLDDTQHIPLIDLLPDLDKGGCTRIGGTIKSTYHGSRNTMPLRGFLLGFCSLSGLRLRRRRSDHRLDGRGRINGLLWGSRRRFDNTDFAVPFCNLKLRNV